MSKNEEKRLQWRALLTETLPYEVPLIFTNDFLFLTLMGYGKEKKHDDFVDKILKRSQGFTKPYNYKIAKDRGGKTTLSVIHPFVQLRMSELYKNYSHTMLSCCDRSEYTLRRPTNITSIYSDKDLSSDVTVKDGLPHVLVDDEELDVSHISSYFSYSKFNLLSKFFDSKEFINLEKRYSKMRSLDVSKCFFNIYTHSISWAVKGKNFAKSNKDSLSFEANFDTLMQRANYNETNGIVVGPEISRIFAEIIFQDIDTRVDNELKGRYDFDFTVRRYVDDYFIFANNEENIDIIEDVLSAELENYKLFLNIDKKATHGRPFVSAISLARQELSNSISDLKTLVAEVDTSKDPNVVKSLARNIRSKVKELRLIVARYNVGFHTLSGWILSTLKSILANVTFLSNSPNGSSEFRASVTQIGAAVIDLAFYVISLDLRVRTTYNLCQLIEILERFSDQDGGDHKEYLHQLVAEEIIELIRSHKGKNPRGGLNSDIEIMNIFIVSSIYLKDIFFDSDIFNEYIENTFSGKLSYFGYVTTKFCLLRDEKRFSNELIKLDALALNHLEENIADIEIDTETYLMLIDYLSSPNIQARERRTLIEKAVAAGQLSNYTIKSVFKKFSFVDWSGTRILQMLKRKQLRSIYTWS